MWPGMLKRLVSGPGLLLTCCVTQVASPYSERLTLHHLSFSACFQHSGLFGFSWLKFFLPSKMNE